MKLKIFLKRFNKKFEQKLESYRKKEIAKEILVESLQGWFGYAKWANTHRLRKEIIRKIENLPKTLKTH